MPAIRPEKCISQISLWADILNFFFVLFILPVFFSLLILFVSRLFGGKAAKQATATENLKNSVVISNPHATLGHHSVPSAGLLDSPSAGSSGGAGGSEQASSPGSGYSGGTGTWGHPSVSSMHTSTESIDMSVSSGHHRDNSHQPITRTGSAKTDRWVG